MPMPVNYRKDMVTVGDFGGNIWRILCRWQGSVYRLVFIDLLCWLGFYFAISFLYRFILGPANQARFASFVKHCDGFMNMIPLSWVLGFFVGMVVKRWWDQFKAIPWPDSISFYVFAAFPEQDESSRMMRRTIVRWVNLTITMVLLKMIEPLKHLETKDDYIQEGLMTPSEKMILEDFESKTSKCRELEHKSKKTKCEKQPSFIWPIPLTWALNLVRKARKEKKIEFDKLAEILVNELVKLRAQCGGLLAYDMINVPLVYTQVVTIALYSYFLICLLARQFIPSPDLIDTPTFNPDLAAWTKWSTSGGKSVFDMVDYYIPIFTILQFVFYVGWLKVAESLMNPFGNDDDDFDIISLLKRNKEAAYLIVDEMGVNPPEAQMDMFWNRDIPNFCNKDKANEAMPPVQNMGGPPRTPDMRHPGMAPPRGGPMQPSMGMAPMAGPPGGMGGPHGGMMPGMRPPMNPPRPPMGGQPGDDQQPLYQNF